MKIKDQKDTIIASLTPAVGGSIAVIRISGAKAIALTDKFLSIKKLSVKEGGSFVFGTLRDHQDNTVDEVVVLIFRAPHSYTGEDVIEINSHANPFIVDRIIDIYLSAGCRFAEPGEFSKRAFLNGKIDLIQAEAVADLIASKSEAGVQNSLLQLKGTLSEKVKTIKQQIIKITSFLELDLDFSEEDIEIISAEQVITQINDTAQTILDLLDTFQHGKIISNGIDVLITGKPNVGKSSLMNALLGQNRAIVSDMPGTTRDLIHEQTIINNITIRFMDSAGIHLTDNSIESEGMDRARDQYDRADIIILVFDISQELDRDDHNLLKTVANFYRGKIILVANKTDIETNISAKTDLDKQKEPQMPVSAKTGYNVDALKQQIIKRVAVENPQNQNDNLITNKRHFEQLFKSREALLRAKETLLSQAGYEFAALDMRDAIDSLSEITGEITTDDMLNDIFSTFCIGK